jgi:signal transduction histidine kinase
MKRSPPEGGLVRQAGLVAEFGLDSLSAADAAGQEAASRQERSQHKVGDCFIGSGEAAALMRSTDWSRTALGAVETWSPSLRMMVSFLLANRFPLLLWWGPEYISLYNDAYRPILGNKHPKSMGLPVSKCWSEIWHILKPLIDTPFNGGPATWMEDITLEINRRGFFEETHFTIAYSPVPDETAPRGIGGVLATVHEITEKVVAERRGAALRDLGAHTAEAKTAEEACVIAAEALAHHDKEIPFALFYLIDPDRRHARLAGSVGAGLGEAASPLVVSLGEGGDGDGGWPLADALRSEAMVTVDDLATRFARVPAGPWTDPPGSAVIVPVRSNTAHRLAGFFVAGISARLAFDEQYRSFLDLAAARVATAIASARAYEEERKRAEELAKLDRAKTAFFSNVSHEFRTPLTLILGALSDLLEETDSEHASNNRAHVMIAQRNGMRLLKLVNSLLDFSRIEAGRVQASYEPTDLAVLTADLASSFRSACEKAGLTLDVDCTPADEPAYVDRDMWEKIVLNLVSNAFKYTFVGGISVAIRRKDVHMALSVRDTGIGIAQEEIPRLFDRFYRVEGAQGRTHEGTGIGLALVQELVKLHGGAVRVESVQGKGSTFTVTVPLGSAHLPQDRIRAPRTLRSTALGAQTYVEEALRWLPDEASVVPAEDAVEHTLLPEQEPDAAAGGERAMILLADDNADMRDYVRRLLGARYEVQAVADGAAALAALRQRRPDLLLSDVMMPQLDGFGLIREIRADPALADLPIVLLSARAGEAASVEGLEAGADDYLIKPFNARELLARVGANLEMARLRNAHKQANTALRELNESLERKVEERSRALEAEMVERQKVEAALQLAQRLEAIGQLTGGVAHDFNNLLTVVLGQAEAIMQVTRGDERIARMATAACRAVERGAQLTNQLLTFARRQNLKPTAVAVDRLVANVNDLVRRAVGEAIIVEIDPAPALWPCLVDAAQFESAILNLAINARDAMPDGGRLVIDIRNQVIADASARRLDVAPGDYVRVSVTDTGCGMAPDVQRRCFEPFFTTKDVGKGTGLGLSQIYGFTRQSGGTATVDSAPGLGTTVSLYLPRARTGEQPERPSSEAQKIRGKGETILLVEDQADVREVIEMTLKQLGYVVLTAPDGLAARALLESDRKIDLLLTDVVMPHGVTGIELAHIARELRADLKIILISGYARTDKGAPVRRPSDWVLLEKPFRQGELATRLAAALSATSRSERPVGSSISERRAGA